MDAKTVWERAKVEATDLLEHVQKIIDEGNARRIVIRQKGVKVVEFPINVGVVGVVIAPLLAAVGAIAALATECTVEVERPAAASKTTKSTSTTKKAKRSTGKRS